MRFIIVDLPEPDVPMIAIDAPRSMREIDAAQRVDEVVAHHVRALDAAHLDQRAPSWACEGARRLLDRSLRRRRWRSSGT